MAPKKIIATPVERLTLQQLVRATPSSIVARATRQCRLIRKQYAAGSLDGFRRQYGKNRLYYNEMRIWSVCTGDRHNTYLRFFGPPSLTTPVWVWCDCNYAKFYLEVVLSRYNCSTIRNSNGMLPVVRNRRMVPHLCKHMLIAAQYAVKEKRDLVQEEMARQEEKKQGLEERQATFRPLPSRGLQIPRGKFISPGGSSSGLVDL